MDVDLDARLAEGSVPLGKMGLCLALLKNDARFPWLLLVPMRPNITELFELPAVHRHLLIEETQRASRVIKEYFGVDKMNIASLGNIVPQLHWHIVGRRVGDAAWPGPVWGVGEAEPYAAADLDRFTADLPNLLGAQPMAATTLTQAVDHYR